MALHPTLIQFFRAILTAKRSLKLYPEGSKQAEAWAPRFRRALTDAVDHGLTFPIGVGRDRFYWAGGELLTADDAMEALRFDFYSRGIISVYIDTAVVDWDLRAFFELLCMPANELPSVYGAPAFLRSRGVIGITVGTPSLTGETADNSKENTSEGDGTAESQAILPPLDALEVFAESILVSIDDYFKELVFDRAGLVIWFGALFATGGIDSLFLAVRMLGATAEHGVDREIRLRTILEAIFQLPHTVYAELVSDRLIPMSPYDMVAFNLLSQVTEDELRLITQYVSQEKLITFSTDLVEFTWETGKRQRLIEAVTWSLQQSGRPEKGVYSVPLPPDDPILNELREEIISTSQPEALLERSIEILLSLVFDDNLPADQPRPVKALTDAMHEALSLNMPDLCLSILREVIARTSERPTQPETASTIGDFIFRSGDPKLIVLITKPLRVNNASKQIETAVEYLRLTGERGIEAFTELLAGESDRRVRARMCEVLTRVGPSAISILGEHASDTRWFLARNVVNILGKIRQPGGVAAVTAALNHIHPRVRVEAIRAALLIDSPETTALVIARIDDPEPSVRRSVIAAISRKGVVGNVDALRKVILAPIGDPEDFEIKVEAINALITIGSVSARSAIEELADRRVGLWSRAPRRLQTIARESLMRFSLHESLAQGELLER